MNKKKLIPAVIAIVLCIATAICIPVFAKDGYANLPANANSDNLAVKCIESIIDSKGNKNAEKAADGDINTVWKSSGKADSLILTFKEEQTFNTVILREKNWKINSFQLSYFVEDDKGGHWEMLYKQERIDDFRLCTFDAVTSKQLKFEVTDASGKFKIREIEVYNIDKKARSEFRVSDYLVLSELANGSAYDPESENYFDPGYCSFVNQLHLIAVGCWDNEGNININDGFNKETIKAEVEKIPSFNRNLSF